MDPQKIQQALQQLDEKAETLQKQGKYGESLDILEEILNLKRKTYGEESDQYYKTSEKLCELCNLIAMICLEKEKFEASLDFLKKAEALALNSLNYKAITYNNMACYYRKTNKLRTALQYLEKALKIEISMDQTQTLADTHLNMCAVLSQLDRHQEALEHSLLSVVYLQDEFHDLALQQQENKQQQQKEDEEQQQQGDNNEEQEQKTFESRVSVLAIAYHNMGVELEYLKRYEEAIQTYTKAVNFGQKNLGPEHQLVENLINVRQAAIEQIDNQRLKEGKRRNLKSLGNIQRINRVTELYQDPAQRPKTYGSSSNQKFQKSATSYGSSQNQFYQPQGTQLNFNNAGGAQKKQGANVGSKVYQQQIRPLNNPKIQEKQQQQQQQQEYEDQEDYNDDQQVQQQENDNNFQTDQGQIDHQDK